MNICEDCKLYDCASCYESDCDCNLASHTLTTAIALRDSAVIALNMNGADADSGEITLQVSTPNGADDSAEFNLLINGRTFHVVVKA